MSNVPIPSCAGEEPAVHRPLSEIRADIERVDELRKKFVDELAAHPGVQCREFEQRPAITLVELRAMTAQLEALVERQRDRRRALHRPGLTVVDGEVSA